MEKITKDMVAKAKQDMKDAIEHCKVVTLAYMNEQLAEKGLNKDVVRKSDGEVGVIRIENLSLYDVAEYCYRFYPYTRGFNVSKRPNGDVKDDLSEFEPAVKWLCRPAE